MAKFTILQFTFATILVFLQSTKVLQQLTHILETFNVLF